MGHPRDYVRDMELLGLKRGMRIVRFQDNSHSAIDIGGNLYGQRFFLSKQGAEFPVHLNTARQLSTSAWAKPYNGITYHGTPFKTEGYGSWHYEY